jgi:hypothetical protein
MNILSSGQRHTEHEPEEGPVPVRAIDSTRQSTTLLSHPLCSLAPNPTRKSAPIATLAVDPRELN